MKKKILLVTADFEKISLITSSSNREKGLKLDENSHYPLGLAYLHSVLEKEGHNVKTLFLNYMNFRESFSIFKNEVKKFSPDLVGLQMLTANRISTTKFIKHLHDKYPSVKIVIGGIHATFLYHQLLKKYPYITIVIGEGELTFPELIKELFKTNSNLKRVKGIAFWKKKLIITPKRPLIVNLDTLPFPKHEIFFQNRNRTRGNILTSRGCPYGCSFCCLDLISEGKVRKRSVTNVIEEIETMIKNYKKMDTIWIHDDSFLIDIQRAIKFCDEIIKRKIKIQFVCSARVKPISEELVNKLEKANFKMVLLGVESGSEDILKKCHKGITKKDIETAVSFFSKSNIVISIFLIVGLPGETIETIKETINFVKKLQRIKYIYIGDDSAILTIYPGTEIYSIAKLKHQINDNYWFSKKPTPLFTVENNMKKLLFFKDELLYSVSFERFFTLKGFKRQYTMTPYIVKYFIKNIKFFYDNKNIILKRLSSFKLLK